jgi:flavin-dependent dehydrogenase
MQDHEYNVGFGIFSPDSVLKRTINLKEKFKLFVESFPLARELMQQSDRATDLRSAALRYDYEGAYPFINGPIVAVGETIGTTLPFIGEGIGKAMESGHLAAEAVDRALDSKDLGKLSRYHQQIEFEFKTRYQGYRKAGKWLARPRLNDFIIKQFGNSRYAKKALADVIAETKNPEDIFCLKGIFKSFWT